MNKRKQADFQKLPASTLEWSSFPVPETESLPAPDCKPKELIRAAEEKDMIETLRRKFA